MKLLHSTTTMLNTKEFNKLSDNIIDALYRLNLDIQDIYDIHINYIEDSWVIDFLPLPENLPVIKVDTYTDYNNSGKEILRIDPIGLEDFPDILNLKDASKSYDMCINYMAIFDFIVSLYDFEYELN